MYADLNYVEDSAGGPDVTVGILPKLDKVVLLQVFIILDLNCFSFNCQNLSILWFFLFINYLVIIKTLKS